MWKKWIWTETDEEDDIQKADEDIQETFGIGADEDIQETFILDDKASDGASSGSNYEPLASLDAESDEQSAGAEIGSSLTRHPDADVESEDALVYIDEEDGDAGAKIGSGGKKQKQGLAGRNEIQNIRSQLPSVDIDRGQKRKAAQNQKYE